MTQVGKEVMLSLDDQICRLGICRSTEKPSGLRYSNVARRS